MHIGKPDGAILLMEYDYEGAKYHIWENHDTGELGVFKCAICIYEIGDRWKLKQISQKYTEKWKVAYKTIWN